MENVIRYQIKFTNLAEKHLQIISCKKTLAKKLSQLLTNLSEKGPNFYPPEFELLKGRLKGYYSRRLNNKDRLVYTCEDQQIIIYSILTHYEDM